LRELARHEPRHLARAARRREQRHAEPDIARARDLAEAYHYLDYYGHAYAQPDFLGNNQTVSGSWRTGRFIAQLAHQVLDLGGDPAPLLEPRSDYMRAGIRIALGSSRERLVTGR
jgi:hypothetical protein